ncbi:MAG: hypothetical protein AAGK01_11405 [Pseudomonadota bacterium]
MKLINTTDTLMTIRGVDFPPGETVDVKDADLAAKCDAMPEFERAPKATKKTPEAPTEVEADGEDQE